MLLSELAMLKYVNTQAHPNIIGLIGCCTQGIVTRQVNAYLLF